MALGGGTFVKQNKTLHGAYINFMSPSNKTAVHPPPEQPYVIVPDIVGMTLSDAIDIIEAAGLTVRSIVDEIGA